MLAERRRQTKLRRFPFSYLPGLPYKGITIRHLHTHNVRPAGLSGCYGSHWDKSKVASNDDNIDYLIKYHPAALFPPGEKYDYSNTGYMFVSVGC
jgi:CubicO group peptidase (beta-lactamase class C family)